MRKSYKFKKHIKIEKNFSYNSKIRVPRIFVIDELGEKLGEMDTAVAVQLAQDKGLDLVEVNPSAEPPVCKIMNFGSFKYQKEKQAKKQIKQTKALGVKSIRISMKIGQHDIETRIKQANKFLEKGHKLKIELILRGREFTHIDLAKNIIAEFKAKLGLPTQIEQATTKQGNKLFIILIPDKVTPPKAQEQSASQE